MQPLSENLSLKLDWNYAIAKTKHTQYNKTEDCNYLIHLMCTFPSLFVMDWYDASG